MFWKNRNKEIKKLKKQYEQQILLLENFVLTLKSKKYDIDELLGKKIEDFEKKIKDNDIEYQCYLAISKHFEYIIKSRVETFQNKIEDYVEKEYEKFTGQLESMQHFADNDIWDIKDRVMKDFAEKATAEIFEKELKKYVANEIKNSFMKGLNHGTNRQN